LSPRFIKVIAVKRSICGWFVAVLLAAFSAPSARAADFNPQEVGMVIENWVVDNDAAMIGVLNQQAGNTHGFTTFTYRSAMIGPPEEARPDEPLATREEWQAWRGRMEATIAGDSYIINYAGHMRDTRVNPGDDPTYTVRWESTWYKNDPSETTSYAEGQGGFLFDDPDFSFSFSVDPLNPSNVKIGGSAGATLWGVVNLTISGEKDFGAGKLTASAGVSADIPYVSDIVGSLASASFNFEYDQKTGRYQSGIDAKVFGFNVLQKTVNSGRIAAPAKRVAIMPPPPPPIVLYRPVNVGQSQEVKMNGGLSSVPPPQMYRVPPLFSPPGSLFVSPYDPFGSLANQIFTQNPAFNSVTNPTDTEESLLVHPGFLDPVTFPPDDPTIPPGGGLAFSYMDPSDPFPVPEGYPPPGVSIYPVSAIGAVPEPSSLLVALVVAAVGVTFRRRATCWRPSRSSAVP